MKKLKLQQEDLLEISEPLLLETINGEELSESGEPLEKVVTAPRKHMTALHKYWRLFDEKVMKPVVGGKPRESNVGE